MAGTHIGGLKTAQTMKQRYGINVYEIIGATGGTKSRTGGFASNKIGADGLTGRERAKKAGHIGGTASRRGKAFYTELI